MRTVDPGLWAENHTKRLISKSFGRKINVNIETLLRKSLVRAVKEFVQNATIRDIKLMKEECNTKSGRLLIHFFYGSLLLLGAMALSFSVYRRDAIPPYVVTIPFIEQPIAKIEFPAVAICSYNLLSIHRMEEYASELYDKDKKHKYSKKQIFNNLMNFGRLVDFTMTRSDIQFTQYLRDIDPERGHNVTKIMLLLTTPCDQQLVYCSWMGETTDCTDMFAIRPTPLGYCCVFNSRYMIYDLGNKPRILTKIGQDEGLGVIIKRNMSDFAYMRRPIIGSEVLIFDGKEYPIQENGVVNSYSALLNVSTYFVLTASEQVATKNVEYISESRRACRFKDLDGARTSSSTYGWCLTMCRRNAIKALCGCVPYFLLPRPEHFVCSLNQLSCLNKHREKLLLYYPFELYDDEESVGLSEEFADALDCLHCLPDCTKTRYHAEVYISRYYDGKKLMKNYFTSHVSFGNTSVLRIFYTTEDQVLLSLETTERWYETLASAGSEAVMLLGVTLMLLPELIFYLTIRWRKHYRLLKRPNAFVNKQN